MDIIFFHSFSLDHDKILFDVEVILVEYFDISLESGGGEYLLNHGK